MAHVSLINPPPPQSDWVITSQSDWVITSCVPATNDGTNLGRDKCSKSKCREEDGGGGFRLAAELQTCQHRFKTKEDACWTIARNVCTLVQQLWLRK